MLAADVERYLALRQTLGYRLRNTSGNLRAFASFAATKGDTHVRAPTVLEWATQGISLFNRHIRLRDVGLPARFLHAEDPLHEVPFNPFHAPKCRPLPYIYKAAEIVQLIAAADHLRESYPLRRRVYATLIGLLAATGLRISEALDLRFPDLLPDGVLHIRRAKFGKSRLIPLHPTTAHALEGYLEERCRLIDSDDHVFLSASHQRIASSTVEYTFRRLRQIAGLSSAQTRPPRIHDLRHTFATRALQQCSTRREAVARHFVALATYMGHTDITHTYWYLEATPDLMADIGAEAEAFIAGESI